MAWDWIFHSALLNIFDFFNQCTDLYKDKKV